MNAKCSKCGNENFVIEYKLNLLANDVIFMPNKAKCVDCGESYTQEEIQSQYVKEVKE